MKNLLFFLAANLLGATAHAQYWQQQVNFKISVSLNEAEKTLDGFEEINYRNNSPDTLRFIWFHLWPNAYKNDRTAFSEQMLTNGNTAFYFSTNEQRGYINRLHFKVNNSTVTTEDHPRYIDVVKLVLPEPLLPGENVLITTPFHVKLPYIFSRSGYVGNTFQITQWYPKPAVYDATGWHEMPYLDQGEFYSEFGNFEVSITVPENYVVAATGTLQNETERAWLQTREGEPETANNKRTTHNKDRSAAKSNNKKSTAKLPPPASKIGATKTLYYLQNQVHDFAWFASQSFLVRQDTCRLPTGKIVAIAAYYPPDAADLWKHSLLFAKDALRFYSSKIGVYPYESLSLVQGPPGTGSGMEYPTITVLSPTENEKALDITLAHEIGHNWFYGALASNERNYPWMDEGMNTFYEQQYTKAKHGVQPKVDELFFQTKARRKTDQPIATNSENFSEENYGLIAYHKAAQWMALLEQKLGAASFQQMMQQYYRRWQFKHPQPGDFKAEAASYLSNDTAAIFSYLYSTGLLPNQRLSGFSIAAPFINKSVKKYLLHPVKDLLLLAPALGANSYDKLMLGGIITNYKLPPSKLQFLAIPLYATGTHQLVGLGKVNLTLGSGKLFQQADIFVNASRFSMNQFVDSAIQMDMQFQKLVPGFKLRFRERNALSTVNKFIQWKTYFIQEDELRITPDTSINNTDTSFFYNYATPKSRRYLNQLQLSIENFRALYPFDATLQVEQAKNFIRSSVTAHYFFNYAKGGGMQVRFFAGKFLYLNEKTISEQFKSERYHLNMTGPNGYEDYTYSNYFLGRNRFQGLESQQIMMRDGAFKVRTDLLANKIGKTDDWLMAVNFNTTVPDKINPLSLLPIKIPLRVFADVGTYAEPWKAGARESRFLFDAGLHLPLFDEALNIYIPIFYSKVYGNYFKSTINENRFLKTISFSISLYTKTLKDINQSVGF